tara:strand:+ start:366 stop:734 length:369 start_codon:yes stop_codon:yes gene_type:complete
MAQLSTKIKLYCEANGVANVDFMSDVLLQDDMVGGVSNPYIKEWNLHIAKPTDKQLATYESAANEIESDDVFKQKRKNAYPEIGDQLDMLWHSIDQDGELQTKYFEFYQAIKAVKVKHPKNG